MPVASEAALGKLASAVVTGVAAAAAKPNNDLSSAAVASSKTVIKQEVAAEIATSPALKDVAVVDVKSAWLSKINIGQGVGVLAMLFTLFGIDLDAETKASIEAGIVGAMAVYTWIMKTWFTPTVTPASVKP